MRGDERRAYSPELLDEAIAQVTELAEREKTAVALCGGLAMQSYGSDRLTKDADFIAEFELNGLEAKRQLSFGGYEAVAKNGVPVDLIVRRDALHGLYDAALDRAISRPGIPCKVVTPDYLAAMKLAAGRPRDILDLHYLITEGPIELERAREIIDEYVGGWYAVRDFDMHVEEAFLEQKREGKVRR